MTVLDDLNLVKKRNAYFKLLSVLIISLLLIGLLSQIPNVSSINGNDKETFVTFWEYDTITGGSWHDNPPGSPIGKYGSCVYILPDPPFRRTQTPISEYPVPTEHFWTDPELLYMPYNWTSSQLTGLSEAIAIFGFVPNAKTYDEFKTFINFDYSIRGTAIKNPSLPPEGSTQESLSYIEYPIFEWAWDHKPQYQKYYGWHNESVKEHRSVYYPIHHFINHSDPTIQDPSLTWRLAAWDDGGERCTPKHGYMNFTLTFPEGPYMLSLYAYDYEKVLGSRESQEYRIYDTDGSTLLASATVSGEEYDNGIYAIFMVDIPYDDYKLTLQVWNPDHNNKKIGGINVALSGIFVDCLFENPGTGTPGYWKTHPRAWPVDEITIGGITYSKEEAIETLWMPDGDKTITMFRGLVPAKLNILIGNDPTCIDDTIAEADEWMATYGPVGSGISGDSEEWAKGEPLYNKLDDYNNGLLCAPSRDSLEN
jgi:hypothetical protein